MIKNYSKPPWILEICSPMRIIASDERSTIVADNLGLPSNKSAVDDAKLMANSPIMYQAIKEVIILIDGVCNSETDLNDRMDKIDKILRNAIKNID